MHWISYFPTNRSLVVIDKRRTSCLGLRDNYFCCYVLLHTDKIKYLCSAVTYVISLGVRVIVMFLLTTKQTQHCCPSVSLATHCCTPPCNLLLYSWMTSLSIKIPQCEVNDRGACIMLSLRHRCFRRCFVKGSVLKNIIVVDVGAYKRMLTWLVNGR